MRVAGNDAGMVKMVDTPDLKSGDPLSGHGGSNPSTGTKQ